MLAKWTPCLSEALRTDQAEEEGAAVKAQAVAEDPQAATSRVCPGLGVSLECLSVEDEVPDRAERNSITNKE